MIRIRTRIGAASLLILAGCSRHAVPSDTLAALRRADQYQLLSLDPTPGAAAVGTQPGQRFHGWPVLGRATVSNPAARETLNEALERGMHDWDGRASGCVFQPRHAIHAVQHGHVIDILICFQCGIVDIYRDGTRTAELQTAPSAKPAFDAALIAAHLQLAPPAAP